MKVKRNLIVIIVSEDAAKASKGEVRYSVWTKTGFEAFSPITTVRYLSQLQSFTG